MKKYVIITALVIINSTVSCAQWGGDRIKGNGNATTITRTTSDYDGIKCAGFMDFKLVKGEEGTITLSGESNLLEYIITEVKDGDLKIKVKDNASLKTTQNIPIIITIPFEDIDAVSLAGSGDLWNEDLISAEEMKVSLAGSGDLVLNLNADRIDTSIAGSGDLTLKGNTNNLEASVAGSGDFHGFDLQAVNTDVSIAGSGGAEVNCTGNLKARVAGSGDIKYKGNPKSEDTKVAGSGSISN